MAAAEAKEAAGGSAAVEVKEAAGGSAAVEAQEAEVGWGKAPVEVKAVASCPQPARTDKTRRHGESEGCTNVGRLETSKSGRATPDRQFESRDIPRW